MANSSDKPVDLHKELCVIAKRIHERDGRTMLSAWNGTHLITSVLIGLLVFNLIDYYSASGGSDRVLDFLYPTMVGIVLLIGIYAIVEQLSLQKHRYAREILSFAGFMTSVFAQNSIYVFYVWAVPTTESIRVPLLVACFFGCCVFPVAVYAMLRDRQKAQVARAQIDYAATKDIVLTEHEADLLVMQYEKNKYKNTSVGLLIGFPVEDDLINNDMPLTVLVADQQRLINTYN